MSYPNPVNPFVIPEIAFFSKQLEYLPKTPVRVFLCPFAQNFREFIVPVFRTMTSFSFVVGLSAKAQDPTSSVYYPTVLFLNGV